MLASAGGLFGWLMRICASISEELPQAARKALTGFADRPTKQSAALRVARDEARHGKAFKGLLERYFK